MKPLRYLPHYTYEDYARWEGQWELIQGMPYDMSPSPKRKHQGLGVAILNSMTSSLKNGEKKCSSCGVYYELDWIISEDTVVRPDIMIVCGEFKDDFLRFPPTLVVESLSEHTAMKDRTVKFDLYEQQGVKYYILLHPDNKTQKIYVLESGVYKEIDSKEFTLSDDCSLLINFQLLLDELN